MLVESHEAAAGHQVNTALELVVGDEAHVDHIKITSGAGRSRSRLVADGGGRRHARASTISPSTSAAAWCATSCSCASTARAPLARLRGATLLKGKQHVDTTLVADHKAGGCQSREVFAAVLDGESRGVFQGKIIVRPHAQKTDARMMTRSLLLSDEAEADRSRSSRFSPTTCSAATARRRARSTRT